MRACTISKKIYLHILVLTVRFVTLDCFIEGNACQSSIQSTHDGFNELVFLLNACMSVRHEPIPFNLTNLNCFADVIQKHFTDTTKRAVE